MTAAARGRSGRRPPVGPAPAAKHVITQHFVLSICTPWQQRLLQCYGRTYALLDGTFKTNNLSFCLLTLVVVDAHGNGVPAGFCLTSSQVRAWCGRGVWAFHAREELGMCAAATGSYAYHLQPWSTSTARVPAGRQAWSVRKPVFFRPLAMCPLLPRRHRLAAAHIFPCPAQQPAPTLPRHRHALLRF
jgi:MULE transposase domain